MGQNRSAVEVQLRFRRDAEGTLPPGEWMWAVPLGVDGGGGTYELENSSFFAPLRIGDVVRAQLDDDGRLQAVGIEVLEPGPLSYVEYPPDAPAEEVRAIADGWVARGAVWSEGSPPVLVTAWCEAVTPEQVRDVVAATAPGWQVLEVLDLDERREYAQDVLDLSPGPEPAR